MEFAPVLVGPVWSVLEAPFLDEGSVLGARPNVGDVSIFVSRIKADSEGTYDVKWPCHQILCKSICFRSAVTYFMRGGSQGMKHFVQQFLLAQLFPATSHCESSFCLSSIFPIRPSVGKYMMPLCVRPQLRFDSSSSPKLSSWTH